MTFLLETMSKQVSNLFDSVTMVTIVSINNTSLALILEFKKLVIYEPLKSLFPYIMHHVQRLHSQFLGVTLRC